MKVRISLLLFVSLCAAVEGLSAQAVSGPSAVELARTLDDYLTRASAFGFSGAVLLAEQGEVVLKRGYGLADRGARVPLTDTSPLHVGSLGKQFTAAAILRLEVDGRLSVEDGLERFFPDVPEDKRAITLHQLLSHTSGLPYLTTRSFMEARPRAEVMREMLELPMQSEPGAGYMYSNPGYALLAGVIEQASGETYERYLERAIFQPAGLEDTGFIDDTTRWAATGVRSYSGADDDGQALSAMRPLPKAIGAGTIVSTVADLYRWDRALGSDAVLPESARLRLFDATAQIGEGRYYGYGWMITRTSRGETLIHHAGDLGGYNADLRRYVERDLVLIVSSNARVDGRGYRTVATNALAYLLNGQDLSMPPTVLPMSESGAHALAGEYEVGSGTGMYVRSHGGGLRIGGTGDAVLSALAGFSGSAASERSEALSERAAAVASALVARDAEPLREHLHASLSFDNTSRWLLNSTASVADSLGTFRGVRSLGTALLSDTSARSYFHLLFEGGSYPVMYGWNGDKIVTFDAEYAVPMETLFLRTGTDAFVSHDLFTGRTIEARFDPGERPTLTLSGEGTPVTGTRRTRGLR
jgi:CubicO group peptidase (beta-lactamase class C family)